MREINEIDARASEKLKSWEQTPPAHVREYVMAAISKKHKRKTPIGWWVSSGVILACMLVGYSVYINHISKTEQKGREFHHLPAEGSLPSAESQTQETAPAPDAQTLSSTQSLSQASSLATMDRAKQKTTETGTTERNQFALQLGNDHSHMAVTRRHARNNPEIPEKIKAVSASDSRMMAMSAYEHLTAEPKSTPITGTELNSADKQSPLIKSQTWASLIQTIPTVLPASISSMRPSNAFLGIAPRVPDDASSSSRITKPAPTQRTFRCEIYGGGRYATQLLSAEKPEDQAYLAFRKSTEYTDIGWDAGVRIHKSLGKACVQFGVQLAQNTSTFRFNEILVRRDVIAGTSDPVYKTGQVRYRAVYLRSYQLDIPVAFGVERKFNPKSGLRLLGGVDINLHRRADSGMMLNPVGDRIEYTAAQSKEYFRNYIGGAGTLRGQLFHDIHKVGRLFLEPALSYQPWSATISGAPIKQRYLVGSLRVGIEF